MGFNCFGICFVLFESIVVFSFVFFTQRGSLPVSSNMFERNDLKIRSKDSLMFVAKFGQFSVLDHRP